MKYVVVIALLVVAVIHLLPVSGMFGAERLSQLYGIRIDDPNLTILMRHRAVLFGLLGTFFAVAAFVPGLQPIAFVAGFASVLSFLWLAWATGGYNAAIGRIVAADLIALGSLVVGALAAAWLRIRS